MLSPHEFATLKVVNDAPEQIELDRADLHALLERHYVTVELLASGRQLPRVTPHGHSFLQAVARIR
ncbi:MULTISPECIES: hypothetical protein [Cupriavidus]|uniref:Preprotein translocase subunit SecA n=3 Tax=Cupriavidus TaxID=106589 RepID=A0A375DB37_9BURK|nr:MULTISPECIES: hypothetical protein [Cupriavidus]MCO4865681.1 hypothetical protein [Cupriavidus sp. WGlv3]MCO4893451.1 hypothetical protein [Cupriavidus sp. WGtm5]CAP63798.1 conserved hypothetical protein [Cupriavidus taiwanensis LMG 19424]SOY76825.1 conserved hypothetical protein [Cupriavidus taiwanensis]SOY76875.1 conserved hypothetical protein [Cupriavidus taiwanensis]